MSYDHPGDAWTDIVSPSMRQVFCDVCAEAVRRDRRERFDDGDYGAQRAYARATQEVADYFCPEADDCCDRCGVVAGEQHKEEE